MCEVIPDELVEGLLEPHAYRDFVSLVTRNVRITEMCLIGLQDGTEGYVKTALGDLRDFVVETREFLDMHADAMERYLADQAS